VEGVWKKAEGGAKLGGGGKGRRGRWRIREGRKRGRRERGRGRGWGDGCERDGSGRMREKKFKKMCWNGGERGKWKKHWGKEKRYVGKVREDEPKGLRGEVVERNKPSNEEGDREEGKGGVNTTRVMDDISCGHGAKGSRHILKLSRYGSQVGRKKRAETKGVNRAEGGSGNGATPTAFSDGTESRTGGKQERKGSVATMLKRAKSRQIGGAHNPRAERRRD